jgi:DNA-binding MarR family transcriptional regulator
MENTSFELVVRLFRAQSAVAKWIDRPLSAHGLSIGDLLLLQQLASAPDGRLRRVDLAERLGMSPSGVTRCLGPLERIGLVEREANPRDARIAYAALTPAGERVAAEALATADAAAEELFSSGLSPESAEALAGLLDRLVGRLGTRRIGASQTFNNDLGAAVTQATRESWSS